VILQTVTFLTKLYINNNFSGKMTSSEKEALQEKKGNYFPEEPFNAENA